jgi:D-lyxose ketol-isomerase
MKRSEINAILTSAQDLLDCYQFKLPRWAAWSVDDWKLHRGEIGEIIEYQLGWDITDFGSGDFAKRGLTLFTLRNGRVGRAGRSYAEKIMIVGVDQETPLHFHFNKTEDIINRGGGDLVIQFWNSDEDEGKADTPVRVGVDGISRTLEPGGELALSPGDSVCLPAGLYHRFYGQGRPVVVGEVSQVNDDRADNRFFEKVGRFPSVVEDEEPWRLLSLDYPSLA